MPFSNLPKPLYEMLPQIYLVVGIGAALGGEGLVGTLSGLALAVAGVHIRFMRKRYRDTHARQQALLETRLRRAREARMG
jgi:hypothetical protein